MPARKRKVVPKTTTDIYINPYTDFGFKRLFGEEVNKDLLMDFLSSLLAEEQGTIVNVTYLKNEQVGALDNDRKAIFDIYCENANGEKFIVEMQKAKHNYFKFPIREQALKGEWDYNLKAVYTIGILDFVFDEDKNDEKFIYKVKLTDIETNKIFYNKLTFVYLEMPKYSKDEKDLETNFDKWLYVLKNLPNLTSRPARLQERVFKKLFEVAEIANFSQKQLEDYEESLKIYRDMKGVIETAKIEGEEKGRAEGEKIGIEKGIEKGKLEVARNLLDIMDDKKISAITGLPIADIMKLRKN